MTLRGAVPFLLLLAATACLDRTPPPEAPDALDENLRWFWVQGASADDATLLEGAAKLAVAGKADTRTTPFKGQARFRLAPDDLAPVGLEATAPSTARGLMVVNLFDCTLPRLERILAAVDQRSQYEGVYDAYARTWTSDGDAFLAGAASALTWDVEVKASLPVADAYTSQLKGSLRRVAGPAEGATKGPFLVARTWLTAPATFGQGSTSHFTQDYQVEVFWEQAPGRIFHAYGLWRDIKVGSVGLTLEDDGFLNIVLDNLVAWDAKTAALCRQP